jgi:23S rRNA (cytosine1962-C5)-methyltransferase
VICSTHQPLLLVYNDRSQGNSRIDRKIDLPAEPAARPDRHEWAQLHRPSIRPDPLFLDLQTRGWVKQHSAGKRCSTCLPTWVVGLPPVAPRGVQPDFAEATWRLAETAAQPAMAEMEFIQSDYFSPPWPADCPAPGQSCRLSAPEHVS